jgi:hypothetical protein
VRKVFNPNFFTGFQNQIFVHPRGRYFSSFSLSQEITHGSVPVLPKKKFDFWLNRHFPRNKS